MKIKAKTNEDQKFIAMEMCWKYLSFRSRSEKEIVEYLKKKKFDKNIIIYVLNRIKELGYINDAKFASNWANYRKNQGKGSLLINHELQKKGIDSTIINETINGLYESKDEEIRIIRAIADKKLNTMKKLEPKKQSDRLIGFLVRMGFSIDKIFRALESIRKYAAANEE
jgi:regulatory protein